MEKDQYVPFDSLVLESFYINKYPGLFFYLFQFQVDKVFYDEYIVHTTVSLFVEFTSLINRS